MNHSWRCSDEPWVQVSGLTWPWVCSWIRSSPMTDAASSACAICSRVSGSRKPVSTALPPHTPAKQSAWSSVRTAPPSAPASRPGLEQAEQVLHVVAVLVGDDVHLGERAALGAELRLELVEEAEVEVDRLVERAVERADRAGGAAAAVFTASVKSTGARSGTAGRRPGTPRPSTPRRLLTAPTMRQSWRSLACAPVWHSAAAWLPTGPSGRRTAGAPPRMSPRLPPLSRTTAATRIRRAEATAHGDARRRACGVRARRGPARGRDRRPDGTSCTLRTHSLLRPPGGRVQRCEQRASPWPGLREALRQPGDRVGVAPLDSAVRAVEQLEAHATVVDADGRELGAERLGPEVEVELVAAAAVDPDGAQATQRVGARDRPSEPGPMPAIGPRSRAPAGRWTVRTAGERFRPGRSSSRRPCTTR